MLWPFLVLEKSNFLCTLFQQIVFSSCCYGISLGYNCKFLVNQQKKAASFIKGSHSTPKYPYCWMMYAVLLTKFSTRIGTHRSHHWKRGIFHIIFFSWFKIGRVFIRSSILNNLNMRNKLKQRKSKSMKKIFNLVIIFFSIIVKVVLILKGWRIRSIQLKSSNKMVFSPRVNKAIVPSHAKHTHTHTYFFGKENRVDGMHSSPSSSSSLGSLFVSASQLVNFLCENWWNHWLWLLIFFYIHFLWIKYSNFDVAPHSHLLLIVF